MAFFKRFPGMRFVGRCIKRQGANQTTHLVGHDINKLSGKSRSSVVRVVVAGSLVSSSGERVVERVLSSAQALCSSSDAFSRRTARTAGPRPRRSTPERGSLSEGHFRSMTMGSGSAQVLFRDIFMMTPTHVGHTLMAPDHLTSFSSSCNMTGSRKGTIMRRMLPLTLVFLLSIVTAGMLAQDNPSLDLRVADNCGTTATTSGRRRRIRRIKVIDAAQNR